MKTANDAAVFIAHASKIATNPAGGIPDGAWALFGIVVSSVFGYFIAVRNTSKPSPPFPPPAPAEPTAAEAVATEQFRALWARVDELGAEGDDLKAVIWGLRTYIAEDHDNHRKNGWPIATLPEELRP